MKKLKLALIFCLIVMFPTFRANAHDHHTMMKGSKASSKSLYLVQSKWVNRDNKALKLEYFKGKPVIMTMLYTICKNSCPLIMSHLQSLENTLKNNKEKINFVVVSLDPDRDKPAVFRKFAEKHQANGPNWYYLNGSQDNVTELAALLGIKFKRTPDGEIMHTNKVTVLNKTGEIIFQEEDLNGELEKVIQAVKKAL